MLAFDRALFTRDRLAFDKATRSSRTFDQDGRMHVKGCRISKANVCPYLGKEIPNYQGLGLDAKKVYMLYRDPAELEKAAPTFRNSQLLMAHVPVNAQDSKKTITVGTVGSTISFDGTYLVCDQLTVWSSEGIRVIESDEQSELSCSYRYVADMTPGISPEGVAFDGRMRDIMGNHVALVHEGRAGPDVAVNDSLPLELHTMPLKRPNLLARLLLLGVMPPGTFTIEQQVAMDAKLSEMTAKDSDPDEDMEDDPENPGAKRKKGKLNPGKGEPTKAGGALAKDDVDKAVKEALAAGGFISTADAQTMANDARAQATKDAVAAVGALHVAREAVKPLVGPVALDSAEAVYKFALEQEKVALDGVHPSSYGALVAQRVALKGAAAAATVAASGAPKFAADAAAAAAQAIPGLSRIQVA